MVEHEAIRGAERDFDEHHLYEDEVLVVVEILTGVAADDPYGRPLHLQSGVCTVPGTFEFGLFENYKYTPGGIVARGDAYFLTGAEWQSTLQQDRAYIEKDNVRYKIVDIKKSKIADSIIVSLGKKH